MAWRIITLCDGRWNDEPLLSIGQQLVTQAVRDGVEVILPSSFLHNHQLAIDGNWFRELHRSSDVLAYTASIKDYLDYKGCFYHVAPTGEITEVPKG